MKEADEPDKDKITTREALEAEHQPKAKHSQSHEEGQKETVGDKLGLTMEDVKKKQSLKMGQGISMP